MRTVALVVLVWMGTSIVVGVLLGIVLGWGSGVPRGQAPREEE